MTVTESRSAESIAEEFFEGPAFDADQSRDMEWDGPRRALVDQNVNMPWVLVLSSLAVAVVVRMLIVLGLVEHMSLSSRFLWSAVIATVGIGTLLMARTRDAVTARHVIDAGVLAVAIGAFSWLFPHVAGVRVSGAAHQFSVALVGAAAGLLVGALIVLAMARARTSMATVSFMVAGVLLLLTALFFGQQGPLGLVLALGAWGFGVAGWNDRNPATVRPPDSAVLRSPRSLVSLGTALVSLYGIQQAFQQNLWDQNIPVMIAFGFTFTAALASVFDSRRAIEETATRDWAAWRAEVEIHELRQTSRKQRFLGSSTNSAQAADLAAGTVDRTPRPAWASPARQALEQLDHLAAPAGPFVPAASPQLIGPSSVPDPVFRPAANQLTLPFELPNGPPVPAEGFTPMEPAASVSPGLPPDAPRPSAEPDPLALPWSTMNSNEDAERDGVAVVHSEAEISEPAPSMADRGLIKVPQFMASGGADRSLPLSDPDPHLTLEETLLVPVVHATDNETAHQPGQTDATPTAPDAFAALTAWNPDGRMLAATPAFWELIGQEQSADFALISAMHDDDAPLVASAITRGTRTGETFDLTARLRGSHQSVRILGAPLDETARRLGHIPGASYQVGFDAARAISQGDAMSGPAQSTSASASPEFTPTAPAVTPNGQAASLPLPPAMGELRTLDATTGVHDVDALALWLNARPTLQRRLGDRSLLIVCEVLPIDEWDQADPGVRDVLATEMTSRLTSALRASDFLVRIEGPWFAAVIDHAAGSNLQGLLDRFERILNTTVVAASRPYPVSGRARALEVTAGMTPEQALDLMVAVLSDDPT